MDPRINPITLGVSDLKRSVEFYSKVLGWPLSSKSQETVAFSELNGTWLALFSRMELAKDAGIASKGGGFRGFSLSHNLRSDEAVGYLNAALEEKTLNFSF